MIPLKSLFMKYKILHIYAHSMLEILAKQGYLFAFMAEIN